MNDAIEHSVNTKQVTEVVKACGSQAGVIALYMEAPTNHAPPWGYSNRGVDTIGIMYLLVVHHRGYLFGVAPATPTSIALLSGLKSRRATGLTPLSIKSKSPRRSWTLIWRGRTRILWRGQGSQIGFEGPVGL